MITETRESWWGWFTKNLARARDMLFKTKRRKAILDLERQYGTSEASSLESFLSKKYEGRFLAKVSEEEEKDTYIDEVMWEFYDYFMMKGVERLTSTKEQRLYLLSECYDKQELFFNEFIREGKESFFGFFMRVWEKEYEKEREREEFFKYFLGFDLEDFFRIRGLGFSLDNEKVITLLRMGITNFLITEITSEVIARQSNKS